MAVWKEQCVCQKAKDDVVSGKELRYSWVLWYTTVIVVLRRLRQEDCSEFEANQG